jgi:hypothetical protein
MEHKTYDATDLREYPDGEHPFEFVADVAGDNSDLFDYAVSNHDIANKLTELGAVTDGVVLDEEDCCFYAYFDSKEEGIAFLKKLSAYLKQKAQLLEKARAY